MDTRMTEAEIAERLERTDFAAIEAVIAKSGKANAESGTSIIAEVIATQQSQ